MPHQYDRPLVNSEQALELLNRLAGTYNIVTISRIRGDLPPELVRQALDWTAQRHPHLRSVLQGDLNNNPSNLRLEEQAELQIPLQVQALNGPDAWQAVIQRELNRKIDSAQHLMRVVLAQVAQPDGSCESGSDGGVSYLITVLHHAIADGLSSIRLHEELLTHCQAILAGERPGEPRQSPPPPSVEQFLPPALTGLRGQVFKLFYLLKLQLDLLRYRPQALPSEQIVPVAERTCGYLYRELPPLQVQALLQRCRAEQTSVQAALCAALLLCLAEPLQLQAKGAISVLCRSFADLRRHISPTSLGSLTPDAIAPEAMGFLASSLSSFHRLTPETQFWDLAREVKQQLQTGIRHQEMWKIIPITQTMVKSLLKPPAESPAAAAITNVGQVVMPEQYGPLRLESISFLASQAAFSGVLSAAATTFQGRMSLHFTVSEPALSIATAERLADEMLVLLAEAIALPTPDG